MRSSTGALLAASALVLACAQIRPTDQETAGRSADRVAGLYLRHCAACHGVTGEADGPLAAWIHPPPRPFADGVFSIVSTDNGIPSDADLATTIEGGLPGTGMPGFGWIAKVDLAGLARHVRKIAIEGRAHFSRLLAEHEGRPFDESTLFARAEAALAPGIPMPELPEATLTPELLERGRQLFRVACAACHGEDGRGRPLAREWRARFDVRLPRDFTGGVLRGGTSAAAIQHRIESGMPAAGMPALRIEGADMQAVVAYVRSLIPEAVRLERPAQPQRVLAARRARILSDPNDAAWKPVRIQLWPLRGELDTAAQAWMAAVHDGRELAVMIRWSDATRDSSQANAPAPDAVAVQISPDAEPPFLAMGSAENAVHIWQWQAFAATDTKGVTDLVTSPLRDLTDAGPGAMPRQRMRAITGKAKGRDSMPEFASAGKPIALSQEWKDGTWSIVFRRELVPSDRREVTLRPGEAIRFALAIWNGSAGQRGANKSISAWHTLEFADR